jgi:hypothetical protein
MQRQAVERTGAAPNAARIGLRHAISSLDKQRREWVEIGRRARYARQQYERRPLPRQPHMQLRRPGVDFTMALFHLSDLLDIPVNQRIRAQNV